jgi:methyl-accepting chemotaxis protein
MNDIKWEISELSKMVGRLIPGTEEQFLLIGSRLNDVYADTGNIANLAATLVGVLDGAEMKKIIGNFREVLANIETHIVKFHRKFESGFISLKDVGNAVSDVALPLANFRKIVKKLKILGISTKIESSQLKRMEQDFTNLASDVEQLSELIYDKSAAIEKHRASLMTLTNRTLSRITVLNEKSKDFINGVLKDINASIALLEDRNGLSFKTADIVMNRSKETSSQVNDVVMSMQFHDITRQQVEHIRDVLDAFSKKSASGPETCKAAISGSQKASEEDPAGNAEASLVCELQKAQLVDAQDKFVQAVELTIENLRGISGNVFKTIGDIQKITAGNDPSDNFLSALESGTNLVIDRFKKGARAETEFLSAMDELSDAVSTISGLVNDIEEIGEEIELIAVNARVKAARTGEEGAPLGVIAEAIWHLSLDATSQKSTISGLLKKVIGSTQGLSIVAAHEDDDTDAFNRIRELSEIINTLKTMKNDVAESIDKIESQSRNLAKLIEETVSEVSVHRDLRRQVSGISRSFDEIIGEARRNTTAAELEKARRISLQYVEDNYTMQRERIIHREVASNIISLEGKKKNISSRQETRGVRDTEDELGDNVELF